MSDFKIIIEHSKTKRVIKGPFNLYGNAEILRSIAEQILDNVKGSGDCCVPIIEKKQPPLEIPPSKWDG